ncbi:hypothetical protein B0H19DRAFT_709380 [Mycena capillaripes]|nr:hypothetical protein B0H19DRAFT_709380 [Mycena capillaripes]
MLPCLSWAGYPVSFYLPVASCSPLLVSASCFALQCRALPRLVLIAIVSLRLSHVACAVPPRWLLLLPTNVLDLCVGFAPLLDPYVDLGILHLSHPSSSALVRTASYYSHSHPPPLATHRRYSRKLTPIYLLCRCFVLLLFGLRLDSRAHSFVICLVSAFVAVASCK